MQLSNPLLPG